MHAALRSNQFAIDIQHAFATLLGICHVHPSAFVGCSPLLYARLVLITAGRTGEALCVQAVGRVLACRSIDIIRCGERPKKESVARQRRRFIDTVIDGDGEVVVLTEHLARRSGHVQITGAVAKVEHLVLAHIHHLGTAHYCGGDARHVVLDTGAGNIVEVELHLQVLVLCLAADNCHQQTDKM